MSELNYLIWQMERKSHLKVVAKISDVISLL